MAHIFVATSEMAGRVNAVCEIASRLTRRGHLVTVACTAEVWRQVAGSGAEFMRLVETERRNAPRSGAPEGRQAQSNKSLLHRFADLIGLQRRREEAVDAMFLPELLQQLERLNPDLCVIDAELPIVVMAAAGAGWRTVTFTTMLSVWRRPGLPPLHSNIVAGSGARGSRLGIELAWIRFRLGRWAGELQTRIARKGLDRRALLKVAARRLGFDWDETDHRHWLIPVVFPHLPMLSLNAIQLEFPHRPHPAMRYTGPALGRMRVEAGRASDPSMIDRLEALYQRRASGESSALIYCSFGAWYKGTDGEFVGRVIGAVAGNPDWDLVLGLGNRRSPDTARNAPSNVHVFEWAPQLEVLHHADVVIHHGGISSVNESILAGVPMVVYPFTFLDQPGNAARVRFHGLGEVGDRSKESAAVIRERIIRVLSDRSYADSVTRMRAVFENYEVEGVLVAEVESLLQKRPSGPTPHDASPAE